MSGSPNASRDTAVRAMAQGQNAALHNRDLWKPGPLSGWPQTPKNKRLARRIARHLAKAVLRAKRLYR